MISGKSWQWNTPELCMKRCLELNPHATSFWMIESSFCVCSRTTTGDCPTESYGYNRILAKDFWYIHWFLTSVNNVGFFQTYRIHADVTSSLLYREDFNQRCVLRCQKHLNTSAAYIIVQDFNFSSSTSSLGRPLANKVCYCSSVPCVRTMSNIPSRKYQGHISQTFTGTYEISIYEGTPVPIDQDFRSARTIKAVMRNGKLLTEWHNILEPAPLSPKYIVHPYTKIDNAIGNCIEEFGFVECDYSQRGNLFVYNNKWQTMCVWDARQEFCTSKENDILWVSRCAELTQDECQRNAPWSNIPEASIIVKGTLVAASNTGHCVKSVNNELQCWYIYNYSTDDVHAEHIFETLCMIIMSSQRALSQ